MNEFHQLSRRDFLGLALLGPAVAARAGIESIDDRPICHGSMRDLMSGVLPAADWRARYYALVESVDAPVSQWRMKRLSALAMIHRQPRVDLPDLLRSHRIVRLCEADLSPRSGGADAPSCFADVTVFADVSSCEAVWPALEARISAGEADAHPGGLGDAACVGNEVGKWTLSGKLFFRRANVAATLFVMPRVAGYEADRFAEALDRRIEAFCR
ncbi:hypothetical protein [Paludisphaera soli]|uniref:hypothetical protein n=1 Tax=Paludisphaera soli TaxID=2712865 RepID=UPI0013ED087F|nr:hypothetical protein [Paludisphaera soli]